MGKRDFTMRKFNDDIVRRTEAARKSTKRAQARLQRIVNESGGYEDLKKSQMSEMNRQQNLLRRELLGIKLEKIKAIMSNHSSQNLEDKEKNEKNLTSERKASIELKNFGRNYFGYKSTPGVNFHLKKRKKKAIINQQESFESLNDRAGNEVMKLRAQARLQEQKVSNQVVNEKVNRWKCKISPKEFSFNRRRVSRFKSISDDKSGSLNNDYANDGFQKVYKLPPVDGRDRSLHRRVPSDEGFQINIEDLSDKTKKQDELELFDSDVYAPDGRLRKLHRLPSFEQSFEEARKTKYVRTKEKRIHDIHLTVDEIFN